MTYTLLIIFKTGSPEKIIKVSNYGICDNHAVFFYEKNGYRSFVPIESVIFFGREFDYGEGKYST